MTSSRVNARLDADAQRKLAYVQRETGKNATTVLKESVGLYYDALRTRSDPFSILSESGFIGCGKKTAKHARGHKAELTAALEAKYGRR